MTVNTTTRRAEYTGNGTTDTFAVPFQFYTIGVYVDGALKTQGVHYDIKNNLGQTIADGQGGIADIKFRFGNIPALSKKVVIVGAQVIEQTANLADFDDAPADVYEGIGDKLTMMVKELSEKLGHSIRVSPLYPEIGEFALPTDKNGIIFLNNGVPTFYELTGFNPATLVGPQGPPGNTGPAGSPGPCDSLTFSTRTAVIAATIDGAVPSLNVLGYSAVGDWGGGIFKRVMSQPTHLGKIQSADGAWWELTGDIVNPLQFGAVGDGTATDTNAVQSCFDYGAHTIVFPGKCTFKVGTVNITSKTNLRLLGPGQLKQSSSGNVFTFTSCTNVLIDGVKFRGSVAVSSGVTSAPSNNNAIYLDTCDKVTISDCDLSRFLTLALYSVNSTHLRVTSNEVYENSFGFFFRGCHHVDVIGNTVRNSCLYSTTPISQQFTIGIIFDSTDGHAFGINTHFNVTANVIRDLGYSQGVLCHAGQHFAITGNVVDQCSIPISCNGFNSTDFLNYFSITGNTCIGATNLVSMPDSSDAGLVVQCGPPVPDATDGVVSGNTVINCNRTFKDNNSGGIVIGSTRRIVVSGNSVTNCQANGIVLAANNDGILVASNIISSILATAGNTQNGIRIKTNSSNGSVMSNQLHNILGSNAYGIYRDTGATGTLLASNAFYTCTNNIL